MIFLEEQEIEFCIVNSYHNDKIMLTLETLKNCLIRVGQVVQVRGEQSAFFLVEKGDRNIISLQACFKLGIIPTISFNVDSLKCIFNHTDNSHSIIFKQKLIVSMINDDFVEYSNASKVKICHFNCGFFKRAEIISLKDCLLFDGNVIVVEGVGIFIVQCKENFILKGEKTFGVDSCELFTKRFPPFTMKNFIITESFLEMNQLFCRMDTLTKNASFSLFVTGEFGIGKGTCVKQILQLYGISCCFLDSFQYFGIEKKINLAKIKDDFDCLVIEDLGYYVMNKNMDIEQENVIEFRSILKKLKEKFKIIIVLCDFEFDADDMFDNCLKMKYPREEEQKKYNPHLHSKYTNVTFLDLSLSMHRDISNIKRAKNPFNSEVILPSVKWEDVGGLEEAKSCLVETISFSMENAYIFENGDISKKSGILLFGPPGTGKTLLAKAIASQFSLNFISVKGPELLNMYIGESERNIRQVFECARSSRPCIIFFDEIDSLLPARMSINSAGGNVMDRIVSQFITELDSISKLPDVYVIGATNRKDLIDPGLLRSGRFDRHLHLGKSNHVEDKLKIFNSILSTLPANSYMLNDDEKLQIVQKLEPEMSGAEIHKTIITAYKLALNQKIVSIKLNYTKIGESNNVSLFQYVNFILKPEDMQFRMTFEHFA